MDMSQEDVDQSGVIVLGIYIHCDGCVHSILKIIRSIDSVEGVEVDAERNRVTVKGKGVDPAKVAKRLKKKSGKHVEIISPKPPVGKKAEKKEQKKKEPPVVELSLKMYLHCDGCVKDVKCCLLELPGVQNVKLDREKNLVMVKGAIEAQKLVNYVLESTGKHAQIVKPEPKKNDKDKQQQQGDKPSCKRCCCECYTPDLVYATQLFSDENPNACSVM